MASSSSSALTQELQSFILHTLEQQTSIPDTSKIVLPSSPSTQVDQQTVQSVLSSLGSRNVCALKNLILDVIDMAARLLNLCNMNKKYGGLLQRGGQSRKMEAMKLGSSMQFPDRWTVSL